MLSLYSRPPQRLPIPHVTSLLKIFQSLPNPLSIKLQSLMDFKALQCQASGFPSSLISHFLSASCCCSHNGSLIVLHTCQTCSYFRICLEHLPSNNTTHFHNFLRCQLKYDCPKKYNTSHSLFLCPDFFFFPAFTMTSHYTFI